MADVSDSRPMSGRGALTPGGIARSSKFIFGQASARTAGPLELTRPIGSRRSAIVLCGLFSLLGVFLSVGFDYFLLWAVCLILAVPMREEQLKTARQFADQWWIKASFMLFFFAALSMLWGSSSHFEDLWPFGALILVLAGFVLSLQSLSAISIAYVRFAAIVGLVIAIFVVATQAALLSMTAPSDSILPSFVHFSNDGLSASFSDLQMNALMLLVIVWPVLGFMQDGYIRRSFGFENRPVMALLAGGCIVLLAILLSGGLSPAWTFAALSVSGLVFILTVWKARATLYLLSFLIAIYLIFAPTVHLLHSSSPTLETADEVVSTQQYNSIEGDWQALSRYVFEAPIFGHGAMSLSAMSAHDNRQSAVVAIGADVQSGDGGYRVMPMPHNVVLEIWAEFGLFGIVLVGLILLSALHAVAQRSTRRIASAAVAASVASFFTMFFSGVSLWSPWFFAILSLVALFSVLCLRRAPVHQTYID